MQIRADHDPIDRRRRGPRLAPTLALGLGLAACPIALATAEAAGVAGAAGAGGPPLAVAAAAIGLFAMAGRRASRVRDSEALADRVGLPLLGTVPELPKVRLEAGRFATLGDPRSRRDLEGYLASLDRLREAIRPSGAGRGGTPRSLMIAGPVGGEGRSTLAAQLAERFAGAGLLTLLIDADLRRPTLGRMLELPEGRGLVDVLLGEARPEEVIGEVGNPCGFHAMPAGSRRVDPARLLQGDRFPELLARARASFDLVIVDAPAVLAFPDALAIGRSVNAALLAARRLASRPDDVDRACRRLLAAGVPVLGLAVSGVRAPARPAPGSP